MQMNREWLSSKASLYATECKRSLYKSVRDGFSVLSLTFASSSIQSVWHWILILRIKNSKQY
jgi:hypothetical protein